MIKTKNPEADDLYARFGVNLREARLAADLSTEELAERSGMHWTYVAGLEKGRRRPSLGTVLNLANALGIAPESLWAEPV